MKATKMHRKSPRAFAAVVMTTASALLVGMSTGVVGGQPAQAVTLSGVQAARADDFVDSIGVNTHMGYLDTAYGNWDMWKGRLLESGIRHIRDSAGVGQTYAVDRFKQLNTVGGVKVQFGTGNPYHGCKWTTACASKPGGAFAGDPFAAANNPYGSIADKLSVAAGPLRGVVDSVEGANEYDISGDPNWLTNLRTFTNTLYDMVKANPGTADLPVVGPSFTQGGSPQSLGVIKADFGNLHNYTGGLPETSSHLDSEMANRGYATPGKPFMSTETNSNTALKSTSNQAPVSERAQGIYTLRQLTEDWRKGISRTFLYELLDQRSNDSDAESTWGIVRPDGTPKPAFTALKNMITLLNDKGPSFSAGRLAYTLEGATPATRTMLLQKRDGRFFLGIWQETSVWDRDARRDLDPANAAITLRLDQAAGQVRTFKPNSGTTALTTVSNTAVVPLTSSEEVTFVEVSGSGTPEVSTASPTPTASTPTASPSATPTPAVPVADSVRYVADGTFSVLANGWGPVEVNRSNGEQNASDGRTITIGGQSFAKGLGVHAGSTVTVPVSGATTFAAKVGVDGEVGTTGSVVFQVFGDGVKLAESGIVRGGQLSKSLSVNVAGRKELKLVVTDAGDGVTKDHADWAEANLVTVASGPTRYLTDGTWTPVANGWGPAERDMSNGELGARDGRTLRIGATSFTKGLGVHADSDVRIPVAGVSTFSAKVGIDGEVGSAGSVVFQVFADGVKLYDSGVVRGGETARSVSVNIVGRSVLRLVVTNAGDGTTKDHADWADAKLS